MEKKKTIIITVVITVLVMLVLFLTYLLINDGNSNKTTVKGVVTALNGDKMTIEDAVKTYEITKPNHNYEIGEEVTIKVKEKDIIVKEKHVPEQQSNPVEEVAETPSSKQETPIINKSTTPAKSEEQVVSYFNNVLSEAEGSKKITDSIKNGFITIVDFFFYDKEIKGYKFSELTDKTKLKIMEIAFKIDNVITKKFPNYKKYIGEKATKLKTDFIEMYLEFGTKVCDASPDLCVDVKNTFQRIKEVAGISWDTIKSLAKGGVTKLKNWYEIFSGK